MSNRRGERALKADAGGWHWLCDERMDVAVQQTNIELNAYEYLNYILDSGRTCENANSKPNRTNPACAVRQHSAGSRAETRPTHARRASRADTAASTDSAADAVSDEQGSQRSRRTKPLAISGATPPPAWCAEPSGSGGPPVALARQSSKGGAR